MTVSIFQQFFDWLFDGDMKSPIPDEILKSTSAINNQYAISIFMGVPRLSVYIDDYLNNINLWYIPKDELFIFLKRCVKDFRVNRRNLAYISWSRSSKLFNALRKKIPSLKSYEISLLSEFIDKSDKKDEIYSALSLDTDKVKVKVVKTNKKEEKNKRETIEEFLLNNFKLVEI